MGSEQLLAAMQLWAPLEPLLRAAPALTVLLSSALLPSHLPKAALCSSRSCLPLVRVTPFIPACARVPTLRSIQPLAQGTADRQHGSCGSQGDKTAGSHSPTSHDLAELPKMEMGLVPPLGDIGAGARGWTVQVAEE